MELSFVTVIQHLNFFKLMKFKMMSKAVKLNMEYLFGKPFKLKNSHKGLQVHVEYLCHNIHLQN